MNFMRIRKQSKIVTVIYISVFLIFVTHTIAQEVESDFIFNPSLMFKYHTTKNSTLKLHSTNNTLSLPFLDDFSKESIYPEPSLWLDSNVFVNRDYPVAPPTLGVATFDGVSKTGCPYDTTLIGNGSFPADTLTSKPINLSGLPADSTVVLSFYWQASSFQYGRGNDPEPTDTLLLQFKNPSTNQWKTKWFRKGYNPVPPDTGFHLVIIPIADTAYLKNGFQFRFVNYATINGNVDHWHIDYVYLDKNRTITDTVLSDVAFAYNSRSFLKNYYAMPLQQYTTAEMKSNLSFFIRNNDTVLKNISIKDTIFNSAGIFQSYYSLKSDNIAPFQTTGYMNNPLFSSPSISDVPPNYIIPVPPDSSYTLECIIHSSPDKNRWNDTLRYTQVFSNYYAYDDGSPESSYGLNACSGYPGEIAYKFTLNKPDSLFALMMLFNWVSQPFGGNSSVNQQPFKIRVWNDNGGMPGNVIYESDFTNPNFQYVDHTDWGNLTTMFYPYVLESKVNVNGTFYVGLIQFVNPCSTIINIGLDKNTNSNSKMFYNVGNGWTQSVIKGSWMIRPVLGNLKGILNVNKPNKLFQEPFCFPNPSNGILWLKMKRSKVKHIQIYNSMGIPIYTYTHNNSDILKETLIDISENPSGIYLLHVTGNDGTTYCEKLVIIK